MVYAAEMPEAPARSHRETIERILREAEIPFKFIDPHYAPSYAKDLIMIEVKTDEQPEVGGYNGFVSCLAFNSDGKLVAIWSWE